MTYSMEEKFEKYWGDNERANLLLYVAVILDPRYNLKPMVHCLNLTYEHELGNELSKKVEATLRRLYEEYKSNASIVEDEIGQSSNQVADERMEDLIVPFGESTKHLYADDASEKKTEVDRYLMEACEKQGGDFKVLDWWKGNSTRYKVLALIAKDI
ncbi:hypothetical protein Syun_003784 [Stephania yunnanensis]|uniref:hAT-like transposase RNase-H fold domain-containing protein n=1 Tax=Stephania yunnanensis TaxID=152371 RepID=A0AAP0L1S3_9MAGN